MADSIGLFSFRFSWWSPKDACALKQSVYDPSSRAVVKHLRRYAGLNNFSQIKSSVCPYYANNTSIIIFKKWYSIALLLSLMCVYLRKCFRLRCLQGHPRSILAPIESTYATSCWSSIVTLLLYADMNIIFHPFDETAMRRPILTLLYCR